MSMELKIGNKVLKHYNGLAVSTKYDSVASSFGFTVYFDPENADHKEMFKPLTYKAITISYKGKLLLTGQLFIHKFTSTATKELLPISGYSKTVVLEHCEPPASCYPLQGIKLNLKEITEKILKEFGLKLVVDQAVSQKANSNYKNSTGGDTQKSKDYICELAGQHHVIVTHNEKGDLVFTEAKTEGQPIYDFVDGMPNVKMELNADATKMHSALKLRKDASRKRQTNKAHAELKNPYVEVFRPRAAQQSSGNDTSTEQAARNLLSDELRAITVTIEIQGWELDGELVRPNQTITIKSPTMYLYNKTKFFIEQVDYKGGDGVNDTAVLTCVLPEVYNNKTPKNIFDVV
jgi:prophage tail gpP-like protein